MARRKKTAIPVNIIGGPLGVGKTTTINHLLSQKPEDEKWAVLVNEYGLVGLQRLGATEAETRANGLDIKEVAEDVCCSAGFMFEVSLMLPYNAGPTV